MRDPHTHESRGFGFVTMESPAEADAAVAALNGQEFFGKTIVIEKVCSLFPYGECNTKHLVRPGEDVLELPPRAGTTVPPSVTNANVVVVKVVSPFIDPLFSRA